ncbi:MAG: hypothetical protein U5N86_06830 [Planctomycetota bacterium]|nr:hypothetical protein [Planctomycetota bacterium]
MHVAFHYPGIAVSEAVEYLFDEYEQLCVGFEVLRLPSPGSHVHLPLALDAFQFKVLVVFVEMLNQCHGLVVAGGGIGLF